MKTIGNIIKWSAIVLVVLVLGGCAAMALSLGKAADDADKKADKYSQVAGRIKLGMSEAEVVAIAGEPESRDRNVSEFMGEETVTVYIYYGVLAEDGWQLVFEDDKLRSINGG